MRLISVILPAIMVMWTTATAGNWGGGFRLFQRLPVSETRGILDANTLVEPYLTYQFNDSLSLDFCIGIARLDRVPIFEQYNPTGEERITGDHKNACIVLNTGMGIAELSLGFGYTKRVHTDSYTVYGSIPYTVQEQDVEGGLMVIGGITLNPVPFANITTQLRYHSKRDFWLCLGAGLGF